ncbi:mucin-related [Striga asiatica]|uniref:Mucin-related n=1 Tax=Striga asiatica TaxID=4170 RepID=A0A5A7Q5U3_STRAF|nr:mucin-related [Striga asiatica]
MSLKRLFESLGWDVGPSSCSTGLKKEHFDGEVVGQQVRSDAGHNKPSVGGMGGPKEGGLYSEVRWTDEEIKKMNELETANRKGKAFVDSWDDIMDETTVLMKQVREPRARGSYLKDSEKAEMYKKHKENPEVYTVERLAKEYRIMRQRVHAILWLKELEEEEEKKLGYPLDDSVEQLLHTCPE